MAPPKRTATHGAPAAAPPPTKKRRGHAGDLTINGEAEVVALSPATLLATNRFVCEVCGKGFQREQNLQLHRRGHNLPWRLKAQRSSSSPGGVARRRVYVCPEPACAHHEPARALGDLTGLKKHFSRKHGEKKWKCDKCSKKYAVISDWKAHSKVCGTREYKCDCGTVFSRRDSFVTHRAFCDALALDTIKLPVAAAAAIGGIAPATSSLHHTKANTRFTSRLDHLLPAISDALPPFFPPGPPPTTSALLYTATNQPPAFLGAKQPFTGLLQLPDLRGNGAAGDSDITSSDDPFGMGSFFPSDGSATLVAERIENNGEGDRTGSSVEPASVLLSGQFVGGNLVAPLALPQMSATALLQKAAQMGSTMAVPGGAAFSPPSFSWPHPLVSSGNNHPDDAQHLRHLVATLGGGSASLTAHSNIGFDSGVPPHDSTRDFLGWWRREGGREGLRSVEVSEMELASVYSSFSGRRLE